VIEFAPAKLANQEAVLLGNQGMISFSTKEKIVEILLCRPVLVKTYTVVGYQDCPNHQRVADLLAILVGKYPTLLRGEIVGGIFFWWFCTCILEVLIFFNS